MRQGRYIPRWHPTPVACSAAAQDDVEDEAMARFVGVLVSLRQKHQDLLQPLSFASAGRDFRWHGAYDGARHNAPTCERGAYQPFRVPLLPSCSAVSVGDGTHVHQLASLRCTPPHPQVCAAEQLSLIQFGTVLTCTHRCCTLSVLQTNARGDCCRL